MALLKDKVVAPKSLTASVQEVRFDRKMPFTFSQDAWQNESWRFYDIIGELRFVSNWVAGAISRARLFVGKTNLNGEVEREIESPPVARLAAIPLGSGPMQSENLRVLGINHYIPGEGFAVGPRDPDDESPWIMVSGDQIEHSGNRIFIKPGNGLTHRMEITQDMVLLRSWTPHPRFTNLPDSPTRAAIPVLRELELLTKREFAELDSRLTGAGVWFLPQGIDFPTKDNELSGLDGFMQKVSRASSTSIKDQTSAEAMTPIGVTVPDHVLEHLERFKEPARFWSDLSEQIPNLRDQALRRLALGLDIPPDIMLGLGDSNRWNAWLSDEQVIKIHVEPLLARIAETFTIGYLHPVLARMGYNDFRRFVYAFDTAPLTVRPNRSTDALSFWDRGLLSDQAAREAGAFGDQTEPMRIEQLRRIAERAVERDPVLLTNPTISALIGLDRVVAQVNGRPGPRVSIEPEEAEQQRELPESVSEQSDGDTRPGTLQASVGPTADQVMPAVSQMVLRAMEIAGGRLVGNAARFPDIPRHEFNVRVGPVDRPKAAKALDGAWRNAPKLAEDLGIRDVRGLTASLNGYCMELLTRGFCHSDDLLRAVMVTALNGKR